MPGHRRPLLLGAAIAVAAVPFAVPAHADGAPGCPSEGATFAYESPKDDHTRVVAYPASPTETDICVQTLTTVQFVLAVHGDAGAVSPTVSQTAPGEDSGCSSVIVDVTDPAKMALTAGANATTQSFCLAVDGGTTAVTFAMTGPAARVDVWLPGHSFLNEWGYCSRYYARWKGGHDASRGAWESCAAQDHQLV